MTPPLVYSPRDRGKLNRNERRINFSLLVYYGEDFALLGEFLCPRRQRNQNAAGDGGRESAKNFRRGKFFLRFCAASPRTPLRESRRPCVDRNQQNMRALTPPFASQNGEDFTGDKQYSPPRWRQKLTAAASYPPGPPGPPDGTSAQQRLGAERQVFSPRGRHPAIVNSEARFHPVGAGTNFTVAERQRAGMG